MSPVSFTHDGLSVRSGAQKIIAQRYSIICSLLICTLLLSAACQSKPAPAPPGKRYELKGTIVSVDKAHGSAVISHDEIKDYMEAMTMPYTIKEEWALDVLKPGDQVQATLVVTDDSAWLEGMIIEQKSPQAGAPPAETAATLQPGAEIPDFRLVNQDNKPIHLAQYKGRALLLTFIYTRCPVPEYCTRMSTNFAEIDGELQKDAELYKKTHLLSISFDPANDTPKVLRSYGAGHTGKFSKETFEHWEFAAPKEDELKRMAQFFGLTYLPDKDQIVHSLQTALIGPDGKLVKLYSGNEWKPSDIITDVRNLLAGK